MNETARFYERLTEVTNELCSDYPNIKTSDPFARLWALEQGYRGVSMACDDLHLLVEHLRKELGLSKVETADLGLRLAAENQTRTACGV